MITLFLLFLAGALNATMDVLSFRYKTSIFSKYTKLQEFFNPQESWVNKYKNNNPELGPKFFGSKTFLVFLTDAWHLAKMLMITSFTLAIVFYNPVIVTEYMLVNIVANLLLMRVVFSSTFELFFSKILIKKK
jgi:hypothetical protein